MIQLYKVTANKAIQIWQIKRKDANTISIRWGQLNGIMQEQIEKVQINQSGRSLDEQVQSRINSRVNYQMDKGYCTTIVEAKQSIGLDANKLLKPMLAQTYDAANTYNFKNMWWQYKYNGHRCLVTRMGDKVFAYSRNGKVINTIDHIIKDLSIPEGCTLDGELYIHNTPLQTISSIVRRKQPDNVRLKYIVYDVVLSVNFDKRLDYLHTLIPECTHCCIATTTDAPSPEMLTNDGIKDEAHAKGFEGFMLRSSDRPYEPGKRSNQLLKVKIRHDAEATITNITSSVDGWAILHCTWNNSKFKLTAPGTVLEKTRVLQNAPEYIGSKVTFEYAELTKDGTPFHPVAIRFRDE